MRIDNMVCLLVAESHAGHHIMTQFPNAASWRRVCKFQSWDLRTTVGLMGPPDHQSDCVSVMFISMRNNKTESQSSPLYGP